VESRPDPFSSGTIGPGCLSTVLTALSCAESFSTSGRGSKGNTRLKLIKDAGVGTPPETVDVTVQSYDSSHAPISSSPPDTAAPSHVVTLAKLTSGGTPGFHTYWSDAAAPITPWPYKIMPTTYIGGRVFVFYVNGGTLEPDYAPEN